jgi:GNAT superfamily N-acetyltransferase
VKVRIAHADDVETVAGLLDEATVWVSELGHEQWPLPYPREELAAAVDRGEVYVAELAGEPVGTVTVLADDPVYWGERPPDAHYVHKLVVRRNRAGCGIGAAIVEWAHNRAAAAGRAFLRLDCLRDDPGIRAYYERLGFEHRGDFDDQARGLFLSLYERPVRATL